MKVNGLTIAGAAGLAAVVTTIGLSFMGQNPSQANPATVVTVTATPESTPTSEWDAPGDMPSTTEAEPEESTEPEPEETEEVKPELSVSQQEAVESAESYIDSGDFSKPSLIDQLKYEDFSTKEAKFAVNYITVDWQQEADDCAASYMDSGSFSRASLADQLKFEGFTADQVQHAVKSVF